MSKNTFSLTAILDFTGKPRRRRDAARRKSEETVAVDCLEVRQVLSAISVAAAAEQVLPTSDSAGNTVDILFTYDDQLVRNQDSVTAAIGVFPGATETIPRTEPAFQNDAQSNNQAIERIFENYDSDLLTNNSGPTSLNTSTTATSETSVSPVTLVLNGPFQTNLPLVIDGTTESSISGPTTNPQTETSVEDVDLSDTDFATLIRKIRGQHDQKVETVTQTAERDRAALEAIAEVHIAAAREQGNALQAQAGSQHEATVLAASREADASIAASSKELDARTRGADNEVAPTQAEEGLGWMQRSIASSQSPRRKSIPRRLGEIEPFSSSSLKPQVACRLNPTMAIAELQGRMRPEMRKSRQHVVGGIFSRCFW